MKGNPLTRLLGIDYPIIQGGLAYLAYADLAVAVSNAGGLGQITATFFSDAEQFRREMIKAKSSTSNPFSINFAIGRRPVEPLLRVALEENVNIISVTGGNPRVVFDMLPSRKSIIKLVLVSSVVQAVKAQEAGADAIIVVGHEGGGHLGRDDVGTMVLVARVVEHVKIPVVASGGIVTGGQLAAALCLGAAGVEMGTRFIATKECRAHEAYKNLLLEKDETSTVVLKRSLGIPARAIKTTYTERIADVEAQGTSTTEILEYVNGQRNLRLIDSGDQENGFGWGGQGVGLIHDIPSVRDLVNSIIREAQEQLVIAKCLI